MKLKIIIFLFLFANGLHAMQPMQWIRDAAPIVEEEMRTEDAQNATFELILLSREFSDPVLTAIARRQVVQKVDRLLKRGANPNADYNELPGLPNRRIAVISKAIPHFPEIVELLLQAGANPDSYGYSLIPIKDSILFKAIELNNVRIVTLLLQYGADPNFQNEHESAPLLLAIKKGRPEIVRLLLQAGANPKGGRDTMRRMNASIAQMKNISALFHRSQAPTNLNPPPALDLARAKLNVAQSEAEKNVYREIIEMLEHPETITRTGLQKLTSEKYKLIEPVLKGE